MTSFELIRAVWALDIGAAQKLVLIYLADRSKDGVCWPSVPTIAAATSKSERSVQAALNALGEEGILTREERAGTSTLYRLNPRKICTPAESAPPQNLHPTPAEIAEVPPQNLHPTPAESAPKHLIEQPIEHISEQANRHTPPGSGFSAQDVTERWNLLADCHELPKLRELKGSRLRAVTARIGEYGPEGFRELFAAVERSEFLLHGNDRWKGITFDWAMKPANFVKILEGNYDNRPGNGRDNRDGFLRAIDSFATGRDLRTAAEKVADRVGGFDRCSFHNLSPLADGGGIIVEQECQR